MRHDEIMDAEPGFVMDMFFMRRKYDDEMHGIRRKRKE